MLRSAIAIGTMSLLVAAMAQAQTSSSSSSSSSSDGTSTSVSAGPNNKNCKVVEGKFDGNGSGAMTSRVTAGPGGVSGSTTGPNGVTVHSGGGSASSSSVATANGKTIVTSSNGDCTIYTNTKK